MMKAIYLTAFAVILALGTLQARSEPKAEEADTKKDTYPLTTCLVSGEKLDAMGKPYVYMHEGQEVRFCCKDCVNDFKKDPEKYLAKLKKGETKEAEIEKGHEGHGSHEKAKDQKESAHGDHSGHNH